MLFIGSGAVVGGLVSILSQYNKYGSFECIDWGMVGKAALTGAAIATALVASLVVGVLVEGAFLTAAVAVFGDTLLVNVVFGTAGGIVAGQYSRLVSNLILGRDPAEGMFQANMLLDGLLGGLAGGVAHWIGAGFAKSNSYNSNYIQRLNQTPNTTGTWSGKRGESLFMPNDATAQKILKDFGLDGILYIDAIPDFKPVSLAEVTIENMTNDRYLNYKLGDSALAQELGITAQEVRDMRLGNGFTWHELNDMETMQLVPTIINDKFGHLGGVGEINIGNIMKQLWN